MIREIREIWNYVEHWLIYVVIGYAVIVCFVVSIVALVIGAWAITF